MADVIMNEMTQEEFEKMSKEVSDEMLEDFDEVTEVSDDELDALKRHSLVPDGNWVSNYTCKDTPSVIMMHVYNKCSWFDRIIGTIKNIGCNMCEDYNLQPFINEFLRLKALDLCLQNSHYD